MLLFPAHSQAIDQNGGDEMSRGIPGLHDFRDVKNISFKLRTGIFTGYDKFARRKS